MTKKKKKSTIWQKFKCYINIHKKYGWRLMRRVSGKASRRDMLKGNEDHNVDVDIVIEQCEYCGLIRGYMTDGVSRQYMDVQFLLHRIREEK